MVYTSRDELPLLLGCVREALQCVAPEEFHALVGAEPADVRTLLDDLIRVYDEASE